MENDSFHKIRPYHNSEVSEAIQRVLEEDGFRGFLDKFLFPNQL